MPDTHTHTRGDQLSHSREGPPIRAADGHPHLGKHDRNASHAAAADANQMNV